MGYTEVRWWAVGYDLCWVLEVRFCVAQPCGGDTMEGLDVHDLHSLYMHIYTQHRLATLLKVLSFPLFLSPSSGPQIPAIQ